MQDAVLSMPNESLLESARSAYVLERIYRIMKRSIWALTEQIRHGTFQPAGYEVDFMQVNELNVQNMILDEEHKMRLVGKIDRMDTRETEEAVYVRIIDYKSGKTTFQLLNLYYGQQLQLVVYLNAAMAQLKKEGSITLSEVDDSIVLTEEDLLISVAQTEGFATETGNDITVVLNTKLTPELIEEGFVREIISKVQTMRKEAGFEVMDKIVLSFKAEKTICEVFAAHKEEIQSEVLAVDIKEGALEGYQKEWNINGHKVELGVEKQ